MSKNNNVNPGQYKVAGRERQGEDIVHEREKAKASATEQAGRARTKKSGAAGSGAGINKKKG